MITICVAAPGRLELADAAHTLAERAIQQAEESPRPGVESREYRLVYTWGPPVGRGAFEEAMDRYSLLPRGLK